MSSVIRKDCVFRQMRANPEAMPPGIAAAFSDFTDDAPQTPDETEKLIAAMETPICDVEGCALSTLGLLRYITSAGTDAPRQALDEAVAPDCDLHTIPH